MSSPASSISELGAPFASAINFTPGFSGKAMREVAAIWDHPRFDLACDVAALQKMAEAALREGENFIAYEAAQRALTRLGETEEPIGLQLVQIQAMALARGGAPLKSRELLSRLVGKGHRDPTTLGRLSRTYRDLALLAENRTERRRLFAQAYRFALRGFKHRPNYPKKENGERL